MEYLKEFQSRILKKHDLMETLRLWEEYCAGDIINAEEFVLILKLIKSSDFNEIFGKHIERAVPLLEMLDDPSLRGTILKLILDIQTTNSEQLAGLALDFLKEKYHGDKNFSQYIAKVGLKDCKIFQGCISNFELLMHMKPGNFVFHTSGWGAGEILEVSELRQELTLEFDYVAGKRDLSFDNSFKTLIPLSNDHFLAMRFGNPDALEERAKKDPLDIIKILLRDLGPKTAAEIKDEVFELVIPEGDWTKWWQSARSKMKKDPLIDVPKDTDEAFLLRKTALTPEERIKDILESKPNLDLLIEMLNSLFKDFPETLKKASLTSILTQKLSEIISFDEIAPYQKIQLIFFLEDLGASVDLTEIEFMLEDRTKIEKIISQIEILQMKKRLLVEVKSLKDNEWPIFFSELLLRVEQTSLKDYLLSELLHAKAEDLIENTIGDLLAESQSNPDTFLWYFQKIFQQKGLPLGDSLGKKRFFEVFLILLCRLEKQSSEKALAKRMHSLISADRFALARDIFKESNLSEAKEFLLLSSKCQSITSHEIEILRSLAKITHPEISQPSKHANENPIEFDIIWTTEEGLKKAKDKLYQLSTSDTIENAKEIEIARSHGDLRENAEFKSALEKREQIQRELKNLSDQITKARVLTQEAIPTGNVGIGSVVTCVSDQGRTITYTILGPWEADPSKEIISFQSKLAKTIFGKGTGEKFSFQNETFTIVGIKSYLKE